MTVRVLQGSVFDVLPTLEPGSVDCCVTSPPYWMLRSYLPKGHSLKPLELGSEPTPAAFVDNLVRVFRLVRDAMAPHATCWINIGDTYCNAGSRNNGTGLDGKRRGGMRDTNGTWESAKESYVDIRHSIGLEVGSLCLIPQRLAIALSDDGWLVRSCVVWHKPAPMPASVAGWRWCRCRVKVKAGRFGKYAPRLGNETAPPDDFKDPTRLAEWQDCPGCPKCEPHGGYVLRRGSWRPTSSWEPVLMLAKKGGYYADGEAVKTPPAQATVSRDQYTRVLDDPDEQFAVAHDHETVCDSGANLRDVWTIAAEPLREKHYAAYPTELVARCLKAGTSARGYCPKCGAPWARVVETKVVGTWHDHSDDSHIGNRQETNRRNGSAYVDGWQPAKTLGWRPTCPCPEAAAPRPGVVLDPFCGSGRTLIQASRLGLDGIGVELNPAYVEMARRLLYEESPLFNGAAP